MSSGAPTPITAAERKRRAARCRRIATAVGFIGRVEYRHRYSRTGGAQYERGVSEGDDRLVVYAEAFDRDLNPSEFSLEAIVAHERGHQIVAWRLEPSERFGPLSLEAEEVVASVLGALVVGSERDTDTLLLKATAELYARLGDLTDSRRIVHNLYDVLRRYL